jgi:hypothetical protein
MATTYEVRMRNPWGVVGGLGCYFTREEAESGLERAKQERADTVLPPGTANEYWIEEIDASGMFEVPPRPTPRERFVTRVTSTAKFGPIHVDVTDSLDGDRVVGTYDRNYSMLSTFEPFRRGDRNFALVSPNYTATSVMDLATGDIITGEQADDRGFCPVGFYVPDWWDVHTNLAFPGSRYWNADREWPTGDFGFVWGCQWGDDSTWKLQYLDLSLVEQGVIVREERFGYLSISTFHDLAPTRFIHVSRDDGETTVVVSLPQQFDVDTGERLEGPDAWRRG